MEDGGIPSATSMLGVLFFAKGRFKAAPERLAAARLSLSASHHLGLALTDLTHQSGENLVDVVTERCGRLEKWTLELPRQILSLIY